MVGLVPTPTDRVDYYPIPNGARTLSWSFTGGSVGPTTPLGLQDVSDWQTLLIRNVNLGAPANAGVWTVSWFSDPQGTLAAGTDTLVLSAGTNFDVALPVRAPYVQVTAVSITGAGSYVSGGWFGVSAAPAASFLQAPVKLCALAITVPAATSTVVTSSLIRPGPAVLNVACGVAVTWDLAITVMDTTGGAPDTYRWLFTTAFGNVTERLYLPAGQVAVRIHNSDASGRPFAGALISGTT